MVLILDDRIDVWESTNPENVIRVYPYKFWNDRSSVVPMVDEMHNYEYPDAVARLDALAGFDRTDKCLGSVIEVLQAIHTQFFAAEDARAASTSTAAKPTVKTLLPAHRSGVLAGVHICFSRCFDLRYDVRENELWVMAEEFGATCYEDLAPEITHVVAKKYGTSKVNEAQKKPGVSIVHLDWLRDSIKAWRHLPEEQYKLQTILMRPKRARVNWAWFSKTRPPKLRRSGGHSVRTRTAKDGRVESDSEAQSSSEESSAESEGEKADPNIGLSPLHEGPADDPEEEEGEEGEEDALADEMLGFLDGSDDDDSDEGGGASMVDVSRRSMSTGLHTDDDVDDDDLISPPPPQQNTRFSSSSSDSDADADAEDTPKASGGKKRRRSSSLGFGFGATPRT